MSIYHLSDDELIGLGRQTFTNSRRAEIADAVALFGYDDERFAEGQALLEAFRENRLARQHEFGDQIIATDAFNDARDNFHSNTYMPHVKVARAVLGMEVAHRRLGIGGDRPYAFDNYVSEARQFYKTIAGKDDIQQALGSYGVTEEVVAAAQEELDELEALKYAQEQQKIRAREATRRREEARRAFADWLARYRKIAKIAVTDEPQLLEAIGILVRSD